MRAVNLIPADQRAGASVGAGRSGGAAYAVLGLFAAIALLALVYGMARHQISSRRAQAASLSNQAARAEAAASQLAPYTNFIALHEQREHAVAQLVDSRFDWSHAFHELGRVLPAGVSITTLTGTVGTASGTTATKAPSAAGATGASATPPGSVPVFTLAGCATNQPTVATMLGRLRLIDGVSEVTLQSSAKSAAAGGAGSGGCPTGAPAFTATVTFDPLPTPTGPAASVQPAANAAGPPAQATGAGTGGAR